MKKSEKWNKIFEMINSDYKKNVNNDKLRIKLHNERIAKMDVDKASQGKSLEDLNKENPIAKRITH